jgi:hypothetical protein
MVILGIRAWRRLPARLIAERVEKRERYQRTIRLEQAKVPLLQKDLAAARDAVVQRQKDADTLLPLLRLGDAEAALVRQDALDELATAEALVDQRGVRGKPASAHVPSPLPRRRTARSGA